MSWNYRIVKTNFDNGVTTYGIHEAHYYKAEDEVPHSITTEPVTCYSDSVGGLRQELERFKLALDKPVLELKDGKVLEVVGL